jgi:hypothetical protein
MSIRTRAEEYLATRRSLGFKLAGEGRLLGFADRLDDTGQTTITVEAALAWACEPATTPRQHRRRLDVVRCFARHLNAFDPTCEIPPTDLLMARSHRPTPIPVFTRGHRRSRPRGRHDRSTHARGHDSGSDRFDRGQRTTSGRGAGTRPRRCRSRRRGADRDRQERPDPPSAGAPDDGGDARRLCRTP